MQDSQDDSGQLFSDADELIGEQVGFAEARKAVAFLAEHDGVLDLDRRPRIRYCDLEDVGRAARPLDARDEQVLRHRRAPFYPSGLLGRRGHAGLRTTVEIDGVFLGRPRGERLAPGGRPLDPVHVLRQHPGGAAHPVERRILDGRRQLTTVAQRLGGLDRDPAEGDDRLVGRAQILLRPVVDRAHGGLHRRVLQRVRVDAEKELVLLQRAIAQPVVVGIGLQAPVAPWDHRVVRLVAVGLTGGEHLRGVVFHAGNAGVTRRPPLHDQRVVVVDRHPDFAPRASHHGVEGHHELLNEAAILAARENRKKVFQFDLIRAIEKVMLGPERKSHLLSKKEKRRSKKE